MQEVKLPQMGQSMEEGSIVEWLKKEGDAVSQGEPLFTIQTDKAEIECEAPVSGTLRKILLEPDIEVPVLTVVALVGEPNEDLPDLSQYETAGAAPEAEEAAQAEAEPVAAAVEAPAPASQEAPAEAPAGQQFASPRARKHAEALGVDISQVTGSGANGRVMEADVQAYADLKITPAARRAAENAGVDLASVTGTGAGGNITKADVAGAAAMAPEAPTAPTPKPAGTVPLSPMRKVIARRMVESKFSAPHYYITIEVDMTAAKSFRSAMDAYRPSFNDLLLRATARALQKHPAVNAQWHGDSIEEVADINLGFAVALPDGLVVPVVKQAQTKSLKDIHEECRALVAKAKDGKLRPDDYSGNTFTVSNLGSFGVDHFTAIINQPDSAILAAGQIKEQVVVIDGGIHIRPIMKLTLSSDHRVIDGALAAQFMRTLKKILEDGDF